MTARSRQIGEWADGAAFNEGGMPRAWFHGTDCDTRFNIFTRWEDFSIGFHFGGAQAANARIDEIYRMAPDENEGSIIPVFCRAANPVRLPDLYTWEQDRMAYALLEAGAISEGEADFIIDSASAEMIFAALEEIGHDCILYGNLCEHKDEVTDSIAVWRPELLKSPFALDFVRADPRLLPQNWTDPKDMDAWQRTSALIDAERTEFRAFREGLAANAKKIAGA